MELVWSAAKTGPTGRKRAAKACSDCHRNKKRCYHQHASLTRQPAPVAESEQVQEALEPANDHGKAVEREGDLVPKSILTDLSPSVIASPVAPTPRHSGLAPSPAGTLPCRQLSLQDPRSMLERFRYTASKTQTHSGPRAHYLRSVGAFDQLPKATTDALVPVYVSLVDACLPILDGRQFISAYFTGRASGLLVKAICLMVCKLEEAAPFLRIKEDGPLLSPRAFATQVYDALDAALAADMEPDRLARIQILTLMHVHQGLNGLEESSKRISEAIHDCHTLSLQYFEPGRTSDDEPSLLWWMVWTFDRVNACVGSRPMIISKHDVMAVRPPAGEYRCQTTCLWLRLSDLLEEVYRIYIPPNEAEEWTGDFPSFEDLCNGIPVTMQPSHIATFQVYYNMIAMLSCRAGRVGSLSYVRRSAAADRVQHILSKLNPRRLLPIPVIPYTISLALTVAYRDLRDGHTAAEIATSNISARCDSLESLGSNWPTASTMARLGRAVLARSKQKSGTVIAGVSTSSLAEVTSNQDDGEQEDRIYLSVDHEDVDYAGNNGERDASTEKEGTQTIEPLSERAEPEPQSCSASEQHVVPPGLATGSMLYGDLDDIFGSMLDTSWINMSQDLIDFADLANDFPCFVAD